MEPLQRAISDVMIPAITGHNCSQSERDLLTLPVRMEELGFTNPRDQAELEYAMSVKMTAPLVTQIVLQAHEPPDDTVIRTLHKSVHKEKDEDLQERCENVRNSLSC